MSALKGSVHYQRIVHNTPDYWEAVTLRRDMLRTPLGLTFSDTELMDEKSDIHLVAHEEGVGIIGCLILQSDKEGTVRMRQVAITESKQGYGIGTGLVRYSEEVAKSEGYESICCHARDIAVPFYKKLGYGTDGEGFTEVGIPHIRMSRAL